MPSRAVSVAKVKLRHGGANGDDIVPPVGARRRERLTETLGALDLDLTADDLARIEETIPAAAAAGERYQTEQMAILDSERGAT